MKAFLNLTSLPLISIHRKYRRWSKLYFFQRKSSVYKNRPAITTTPCIQNVRQDEQKSMKNRPSCPRWPVLLQDAFCVLCIGAGYIFM